jgi:hypothetical protein
VAGWIAFAIFVPSFRESTPGLTLLKGWATFWEIALFAFGAITAVFIAIEHWPSSTKPSFRWDPRRLPPVRDTKRIPRANSIAELLLMPLMASWWLDAAGGAPIAWTVAFHPFRWNPGPVWTDFHGRFYWPVLAVWATIFVTAAVNLVRPYWTRTRLAIRAAGSAVTALMITAVLLPTGARGGGDREAQGLHGAKEAPGVVEAITDVAVFWVLAVTALALACQFAWDAYRYRQCRPGADESRVSRPPLPGRLPNH